MASVVKTVRLEFTLVAVFTFVRMQKTQSIIRVVSELKVQGSAQHTCRGECTLKLQVLIVVGSL